MNISRPQNVQSWLDSQGDIDQKIYRVVFDGSGAAANVSCINSIGDADSAVRDRLQPPSIKARGTS